MEDALYPPDSKGHLCEHLEMSQELQKNMLECYGLVPFEMLVVSVAFALAIGLERRIKPKVVISSSFKRVRIFTNILRYLLFG